MNYIYSTLSNSQSIPVYLAYPGIKDGKGSGKPSVRKSIININGGANVIDAVFQTAKGAQTIVSDEQLEQLEKCASFKKWKKNGFITVVKHDEDADKVAADLTSKDSSAQITGEEQEIRFKEGKTTADVDVASQAPRQKKSAAKK